jgi:hypothetical protein
MEVSGQLHNPSALPPWKDPPVSAGQETGWAPESAWTWWRRERSPIISPTEENYDTQVLGLAISVLDLLNSCLRDSHVTSREVIG